MNFTFSFYFLTFLLIIVIIVIINISRKTKQKGIKYLLFSILGLLVILYSINIANKPHIIMPNIVISKYRNLDTNSVKKFIIISNNRKDSLFKKEIIITDKKIINILCKNIKYSKEFKPKENPKVNKKYYCKFVLKNNKELKFPIKQSPVYGCYIEIYAPGNFFYEHLGDFKNDSLQNVINKIY